MEIFFFFTKRRSLWSFASHRLIWYENATIKEDSRLLPAKDEGRRKRYQRPLFFPGNVNRAPHRRGGSSTTVPLLQWTAWGPQFTLNGNSLSWSTMFNSLESESFYQMLFRMLIITAHRRRMGEKKSFLIFGVRCCLIFIIINRLILLDLNNFKSRKRKM